MDTRITDTGAVNPRAAQASQPKSTLSAASSWIGILLAASVALGRWSPMRLVGGGASLAEQPRTWICVALFMLTIVPLKRTSRLTEYATRQGPFSLLLATIIWFLTYMILSAMWAPDAELATAKAIDCAMVGIQVFAAYRAMHWMPKVCMQSFWTWAIGFTTLNAVLLSILGLPGLAAHTKDTSMAGGPNVFARLTAVLCVAALARAASGRRRLAWVVISAIAYLFVLLSGSRGGVIAATLGVLAALGMMKLRLKAMVVGTAVAVLCISGVVLWTPVGDIVSSVVNERYVDLTFRERHAAGRDNLYSRAWGMGISHPILGAGLAAFPATDPDGLYPHNLLLEVFSEGGLLGFVPLALAVGIVSSVVLRRRRACDVTTTAALLVVFVASQFSGDLYDSRAVFTLMVLFFGSIQRGDA